LERFSRLEHYSANNVKKESVTSLSFRIDIVRRVNMNINGERLWENIFTLGKIGRVESGGLRRLSFTQQEKEAKDVVKLIMGTAGLTVSEDQIGNLIGRKEGTNPNAKTLLIGSHIDTVPNGGIFDGALGVLTGVEVLHTLNENNIETECPIEIIAFTDEEGARFSSGMLGSLAITGRLKEEDLSTLKDKNGITLREAMVVSGYEPSALETVKRDPNTIKAYLELHIEQGKVLGLKNLPAGIVTGIVGVKWLSVKLKGEAGHAGTTPIYLRKDPLAAASKIISFAEDMVEKYDQAVATVGRLKVLPGGINIIPGEVEFTIDFRDLSEETISQMEAQIREYINRVCSERDIPHEVEVLHQFKPAKCASSLIDVFEQSFAKRKIEPYKMPSGAGHDAMIMANVTEMGMLFVKSIDGISHNPKEWSEKEDVMVGGNILLESVLVLAQDVGSFTRI
jgi:allantoate deiminase